MSEIAATGAPNSSPTRNTARCVVRIRPLRRRHGDERESQPFRRLCTRKSWPRNSKESRPPLGRPLSMKPTAKRRSRVETKSMRPPGSCSPPAIHRHGSGFLPVLQCRRPQDLPGAKIGSGDLLGRAFKSMGAGRGFAARGLMRSLCGCGLSLGTHPSLF